MSLSAAMESIPEKQCLLTSGVFRGVPAVPGDEANALDCLYDGEDQVFPTWRGTGTPGSPKVDGRSWGLLAGAVPLGRVPRGRSSLQKCCGIVPS